MAATIAAIYLLAQIAPRALSLEFASFRHLAANSPLFFGAIVGGYHSRDWAAWWHRQAWSRAADAVIVAAGLLGLIAFLTDYGGFARVEAFLGDFIVREQLLPPHNLAIICLYLRILWLLVTRFWGVCARIGGWLFLPLGRDGLLTYCLHVTYIELFRRWAPPLAWEETVYLQLLAEAIVVGLVSRPCWPGRGSRGGCMRKTAWRRPISIGSMASSGARSSCSWDAFWLRPSLGDGGGRWETHTTSLTNESGTGRARWRAARPPGSMMRGREHARRSRASSPPPPSAEALPRAIRRTASAADWIWPTSDLNAAWSDSQAMLGLGGEPILQDGFTARLGSRS